MLRLAARVECNLAILCATQANDLGLSKVQIDAECSLLEEEQALQYESRLLCSVDNLDQVVNVPFSNCGVEYPVPTVGTPALVLFHNRCAFPIEFTHL